MKKIFKNFKAVTFLAVMTLAIGVTLYLTTQNQDIRQRASENNYPGFGGGTVYLKDYLASAPSPHRALQNAINDAILKGKTNVDLQQVSVPISIIHDHAGLKWGLSVAGNICLINGTITNNIPGVSTITYVGVDKTEKIDQWTLLIAANKPTYDIYPVKKGQQYVELTNNSDVNKFKKGDKIFLRTGQTIYSAGKMEPLAELFSIVFINGKRIYLNTPTLHAFTQEYYDASQNGPTTTTPTGSKAPLGIANVTDVVSDNFCMKNMKIETVNTGVSAIIGGQTMNLDFSNNTFSVDFSPMSMGNYANGNIQDNIVTHTGSNTDVGSYAFTAATGVSLLRIVNNTISSPNGSLYIHVHEGSSAYIYNNKILSGNIENISSPPFSIRARSSAIIKGNTVEFRGKGGLALYADITTSGEITDNIFKVSFTQPPYVLEGSNWKDRRNTIQH